MALQPAYASPQGEAFMDAGFQRGGNEQTSTYSGLSLNTRGFLWPNDGIWVNFDAPIVSPTVWVVSATCTGGICNM